MASRKENFNTNKSELDSELSDWPSPEERTRHKRWTSRVKTGCITCRFVYSTSSSGSQPTQHAFDMAHPTQLFSIPC